MAYKDPAKKREYNAAYRAANRAKAVARTATWRAANPDKRRAQEAIWRAANREKVREKSAAYRAAHPELHRAANAKYLKKMAPEARAEAHLVESVRLVGGMCPKFIDPGRKGAPDRMVMLPGHPVYFVEMKRERVGKLSTWQERYHADLRALGHRVWVLWSKEEVDEFLASI